LGRDEWVGWTKGSTTVFGETILRTKLVMEGHFWVEMSGWGADAPRAQQKHLETRQCLEQS
jgi:hypothetical protein